MAKMLRRLSSGVSRMCERMEEAVEGAGERVTRRLCARYPDIDEVLDVVHEMRDIYKRAKKEQRENRRRRKMLEQENIENDGQEDHVDRQGDDKEEDRVDGKKESEPASGPGDEIDASSSSISSSDDEFDDDKWRPFLLNLGLLYKLQRIRDSSPKSWYNEQHIFVHDDDQEIRLMHTFGHYWHLCVQVATALRSIDNNDHEEPTMSRAMVETSSTAAALNVMQTLKIDREDVLFAHATDSLHVDEHCPDFSVVILHELKQVVIVVCGTRMIPAPKMRDVFMDLQADSEVFLHGHAHRGMAQGAINILEKIRDELIATLEKNPEYLLVVIGYSLGAGICQLLTMELLEGDSRHRVSDVIDPQKILCFSYGAPPVFKPSDASYKCSNIFSIVYSNDGLASASVASVTKLFLQIRAINDLQLRRRDMLKMLWKPIPTMDGAKMAESDSDNDDFALKKHEKKERSNVKGDILETKKKWKLIREAVDSVPDTGLVELEHPAKNVFIFKRRDDDIVTRRLAETNELTGQLRLRGAMFNHHMPWGYDKLFDGFGDDHQKLDFDVLHQLDIGPQAKKIYPELPDENQ